MHISSVQRTGSEAGTSAQALGAHQNFLGGCPRSTMSYMVPLMSHNIPQCVQNVHNAAHYMPVHTYHLCCRLNLYLYILKAKKYHSCCLYSLYSICIIYVYLWVPITVVTCMVTFVCVLPWYGYASPCILYKVMHTV